jgi:hypothetical protein
MRPRADEGNKETDSTFVVPAITSICTYNVADRNATTWATHYCPANHK